MRIAVIGFGGAREVIWEVRQPGPLALGRASSVKLMHCLEETAEYAKPHAPRTQALERCDQHQRLSAQQ
jgi:hypothetical protein